MLARPDRDKLLKIGTGGSYNFTGTIADRELRFTVGADYMFEDDDRNRWRLLAGTGRENGPQFWDYNIEMHTFSLYAQGSYRAATRSWSHCEWSWGEDMIISRGT